MARRQRERTEVSCCVKYCLFFFNVFFWLVGGLTLAFGLYARFEKKAYTDFFDNVLTDPAFLFILVGGIMFILGFLGCIGALRENITLLKIFSISLSIIFFLELALGIYVFIFQDQVKKIIQEKLQKPIIRYRDDPDLQDLIDYIQQEFKCCGAQSHNDWNDNIYFNCSSPGIEKCGVPYSCCKKINEQFNAQCGYGVRSSEKSTTELGEQIYTQGCVEAWTSWLKTNMIMVGAVALGVALLQIGAICFAQSLTSDIKLQRSKWLM